MSSWIITIIVACVMSAGILLLSFINITTENTQPVTVCPTGTIRTQLYRQGPYVCIPGAYPIEVTK